MVDPKDQAAMTWMRAVRWDGDEGHVVGADEGENERRDRGKVYGHGAGWGRCHCQHPLPVNRRALTATRATRCTYPPRPSPTPTHGSPQNIMPPFPFPFPIPSLRYLAAPHAHPAPASSNAPKPAPPRPAPPHPLIPLPRAYRASIAPVNHHAPPPTLPRVLPPPRPPRPSSSSSPPHPRRRARYRRQDTSFMPPPALPVLMRTVGEARGNDDREEADVGQCRREDARRGDADRGKNGRRWAGDETNERASVPDESRFGENERHVGLDGEGKGADGGGGGGEKTRRMPLARPSNIERLRIPSAPCPEAGYYHSVVESESTSNAGIRILMISLRTSNESRFCLAGNDTTTRERGVEAGKPEAERREEGGWTREESGGGGTAHAKWVEENGGIDGPGDKGRKSVSAALPVHAPALSARTRNIYRTSPCSKSLYPTAPRSATGYGLSTTAARIPTS
ncbi:hypothetical protein R3P38DRAFT_2787942 [Favolaschia claudopus]|uniref:Uncharacterized protein n=1 Tax=Favolaschia claudopus TaxID=2862362 RepID=A0AAW0AKE2_9AGAR